MNELGEDRTKDKANESVLCKNDIDKKDTNISIDEKRCVTYENKNTRGEVDKRTKIPKNKEEGGELYKRKRCKETEMHESFAKL